MLWKRVLAHGARGVKHTTTLIEVQHLNVYSHLNAFESYRETYIPTLLVHPDDAAKHGLSSSSPLLPVLQSDDIANVQRP